MNTTDGAEKILVIVPAYNEEKTDGRVIEKIQYFLPQADILVVNDGSSDSTSEISRRMAVAVLDLPYNLGIGAAMPTDNITPHRLRILSIH